MHGLLMCSGNDAAVAISEHVGGSEENFCDMMNKKAKEIGAFDTNFVTPHGLDNDEHYSTAYDLALIADFAMEVEYIRNVVCKKVANIKINNYTKTINTTNEMLSTYEGADGIKTGYTSKAGRCLVTSATKNDWQVICVVLGCDTKKFRTTDSIKLLNYAFDSYEFYNIASIIKEKHNISVEKSKKIDYVIDLNEEYVLPMRKDEIEDLRVEYNLKNSFAAPFYAGEKIGKINIYCKDEMIKTFEIRSNFDILRKTPLDYIKILTKNMPEYLKM